MNIGLEQINLIIGGSGLIGIISIAFKIIYGQGKAQERNEHIVNDIKEIKTHVTVTIPQEIKELRTQREECEQRHNEKLFQIQQEINTLHEKRKYEHVN